jgi:TRAP transporter TAXI family solute receptor
MDGMTRRQVLTSIGIGTGLALGPRAGVRRAAAQARTSLAIATGPTGGVYYPLGGGIASLVSKYVPGLNATAETSPGGVDNLKLLHAGKVGLALAGPDIAWDAYQGKLRGLPEKVAVRTLAALYSNYMHIVTLDGSGIQKLTDLKGKRVSTGPPGSGTEVKGMRVLEAHGLTAKDLGSQDRLNVTESAGALKDRKIDAFVWNGGIPTAAILDLAATPGVKIRLVPHGDAVPAMVKKYGAFYFPGMIGKETYRGMAEDVQVAAETHLLVTHERLDESVAYQITKVLLERTPELVAIHKAAAELTLKSAVVGSAVPFHPGALRYYREKGVTVGNP